MGDNLVMTYKGIVLWVAVALVTAMAWHQWGWAGLALATGAVVFWLLLHFNRLMLVVRRASRRPIGQVDSAVMLHARLRKGLSVLQVVGLARALGEPLSEDLDAPTLRYRWRDASGSVVACTFHHGKLTEWDLTRPTGEASNDPVAIS
jgi:hypothetical protein